VPGDRRRALQLFGVSARIALAGGILLALLPI